MRRRFCVFAFICFVPLYAEANTGLPTIIVVWPIAVLALPAVIAIEAAICRINSSWGWGRSFKAASLANVISTVAGIPFGCLIGAIAGTIIGVIFNFFQISNTYVPAFILFDNLDPRMNQWRLIIELALEAPFYFISSAWIEMLVLKHNFDLEKRMAWRYSLRMNAWSYSFLLLILLAYAVRAKFA